MSSQSLTKGAEYENKSFTKSEQLFITLTRSKKERKKEGLLCQLQIQYQLQI